MLKNSLLMCIPALLLAVAALAADYRNITSPEAKAILEKKGKVVLLDVRTPQEVARGYIPGALLIPINEVEHRKSEIPRNRPIIVYCAVGSRSRSVATFLAQQGYGEVYNMTDGYFGWARNGNQIAR